MTTITIEERDLTEAQATALPTPAHATIMTVTRSPQYGPHFQSTIQVYRGVAPATVSIGMLRAYRDGKDDRSATPAFTLVCAGHRPMWESYSYADDWREVWKEARRHAGAEAIAYLQWETTGGHGEVTD